MSTTAEQTRRVQRAHGVTVALVAAVVVAVCVCGAVGIATALGVPLLVEVLGGPAGRCV